MVNKFIYIMVLSLFLTIANAAQTNAEHLPKELETQFLSTSDLKVIEDIAQKFALDTARDEKCPYNFKINVLNKFIKLFNNKIKNSENQPADFKENLKNLKFKVIRAKQHIITIKLAIDSLKK